MAGLSSGRIGAASSGQASCNSLDRLDPGYADHHACVALVVQSPARLPVPGGGHRARAAGVRPSGGSRCPTPASRRCALRSASSCGLTRCPPGLLAWAAGQHWISTRRSAARSMSPALTGTTLPVYCGTSGSTSCWPTGSASAPASPRTGPASRGPRTRTTSSTTERRPRAWCRCGGTASRATCRSARRSSPGGTRSGPGWAWAESCCPSRWRPGGTSRRTRRSCSACRSSSGTPRRYLPGCTTSGRRSGTASRSHGRAGWTSSGRPCWSPSVGRDRRGRPDARRGRRSGSRAGPGRRRDAVDPA